uniref:Uncharacterized protein n=1 Tax=viral metagenome TaxID=1070528 RepID=A0A6C0AE51_9ZZZZ
MEINILEIPEFLRDSEFYKNLDFDADKIITIPVLKINDEINNIEDFKNLFETLSFFIVKEYPDNFIKYYQNNSTIIFNCFDTELLKDFCKFKIKNYIQFFITHKVINLYKLNPEDYENYIDYALNYDNYILSSLQENENICADHIDLLKKVFSTVILNIKSYEINNFGRIFLIFNLKKISEDWKLKSIELTIDKFSKIIDAITNNYDYKYSCFIETASYENRELYFISNYGKCFKKIEKFKINEFNKNFILKEFQKINLNKEKNITHYLK